MKNKGKVSLKALLLTILIIATIPLAGYILAHINPMLVGGGIALIVLTIIGIVLYPAITFLLEDRCQP